MKKIVFLFVAAMMAVTFSACGGQTNATASVESDSTVVDSIDSIVVDSVDVIDSVAVQ